MNMTVLQTCFILKDSSDTVMCFRFCGKKLTYWVEMIAGINESESFFKNTSGSGDSSFDLIEEVFSLVGAMPKYFISAVEATVLSVVENVVFFF